MSPTNSPGVRDRTVTRLFRRTLSGLPAGKAPGFDHSCGRIAARPWHAARLRSRNTILKATLDLIERQGFAAVTVTSAAAAAQVSRQTVYSIFGDRAHLVSEAVALLALDAWSGLAARL